MTARCWRTGMAALACFLVARGALGQEETHRLQERFPVGYRYQVKTRVELSGTLTPPAVKGKASKPVKMQGESAIDYDERILAVDGKGAVSKTVRICRRLHFRRTLAGRRQELAL